jgi:hypothetical protein
MKHFFLLLILLNYAHLTNAQGIVHVSKQVNGHPDIILPKAAIQVEVILVKTEYTKGDLNYITGLSANRAKLSFYETRYGVNPKIVAAIDRNELISHKILEDSIKVNVVPIADYTKMYSFTKLKKWNKTKGITLNYSDDGVVTDGEYTYENKTFDLIVKGIGGVASIVGKFFSLGAKAASVAPSYEIDELEKILGDYGELYTPAQTAYSGEVFKELKAKLDKRYDAAFSRYFYSIEKSLSSAVIVYTPDTKQSPSTLLFALTNDKITCNNALGNNLEIMGKSVTTGSITKGYTLNIALRPDDYQLSLQVDPRPAGSDCLPYNVAARTVVTFRNPDEKQLQQLRARIPQWGKVGYVNLKKPNKLSWAYDTFGELKKLSAGANSVTTDQIGAAAALAEQIQGLIKPDELTELTRKVDLLKKRQEYESLLKESLATE